MLFTSNEYFIISFSEFTQFLAFSKVTGIDTVHMFDSASSTHNRPKEPITIMEYMSNVIGLTFDYDNKKYFYSDIQRGDIQSVFFNGTYDRIIMSSKSARVLLVVLMRSLIWGEVPPETRESCTLWSLQLSNDGTTGCQPSRSIWSCVGYHLFCLTHPPGQS